MHEIQNPVEFLKNIYELCDDKTILHVNVPNSESFHLLWAYKSGLIKRIGDLTQTAIHLQQNSIYNLITLESFIESCGFCVLEKGSFFMKNSFQRKISSKLYHCRCKKKLLCICKSLEEVKKLLGIK